MTDFKINKISIVIPVYNEEETLNELISRCISSCRETGKEFDIILIDDGSSDKSVEIIEDFVEKHPGNITGCILNRNYGQHEAIMAGFSIADGDFIITIDADLQNPPEEFPRLVTEAEKGFDVVGTRRRNRQDTAFRRYASKVVNYAARKATGVNMTDYGCMLRGYRKHIVDAMLQCCERTTFIPVLGNSFARHTVEIEVGHNERVAGDSKYSVWKLINLQFNLLTCMTTFPLRMLSIVGALISLLGFALALVILILRIFMGDEFTVGGVFTLFAIVYIFIGFQFIGLGLLGEYIGRIYNDVRARPRYFVQEVLGRKKEAE